MIADILLAVGQLADKGHEGARLLMTHQWASTALAIKGLPVLYVAVRLREKLPITGSAEDIIAITESGQWDEALWRTFPETMAELSKAEY